jgi:hypothetical protein
LSDLDTPLLDKRPVFYHGEPVGIRPLGDYTRITIGTFVEVHYDPWVVVWVDDGERGHLLEVDRGRVYPLPRMEEA